MFLKLRESVFLLGFAGIDGKEKGGFFLFVCYLEDVCFVFGVFLSSVIPWMW